MALSTIQNNSFADTAVHGFRNLIINGAMTVAQRGTSFTGLGASDLYTLDRYKFDFGSTSGRLTAEQSTDAPNGFSHSFKLSCTTADTSIAASEKARIIYSFEGQDLVSIEKGTSDAKPVTVSFYVKGNAAASYTCEFYDNDNNRQCSKIFNVTTDWTRVELNFPADTTGAFTYDNTTAVQLSFWLMAGSDYTSGTLNSSAFAASVQANRVSSSQTNFFDSTSRTFQITGVQLELGSEATPFEHRSFGDELARCQRYFQKWESETTLGAGLWFSANQVLGDFRFIKTMRTSPTISVSSADFCKGYLAASASNSNDSSTPFDVISINSARFNLNMVSTGTNGQGCLIQLNASEHINVDAEL